MLTSYSWVTPIKMRTLIGDVHTNSYNLWKYEQLGGKERDPELFIQNGNLIMPDIPDGEPSIIPRNANGMIISDCASGILRLLARIANKLQDKYPQTLKDNNPVYYIVNLLSNCGVSGKRDYRFVGTPIEKIDIYNVKYEFYRNPDCDNKFGIFINHPSFCPCILL